MTFPLETTRQEAPEQRLLDLLQELMKRIDVDSALARVGNDKECFKRIKTMLWNGEFVPTEEDIVLAERIEARDPSLTKDDLDDYADRMLEEGSASGPRGRLSPRQEFTAFLLKLYVLTQKAKRHLR